MVDGHAYKDHGIDFDNFFLFRLSNFTFLMLPRVYFKAMKVQCNVTKPIYVHHGKTTAAEHAVPDYGIHYKFIVFRLSRLPLIFLHYCH
jgi:hypothetical protein